MRYTAYRKAPINLHESGVEEPLLVVEDGLPGIEGGEIKQFYPRADFQL